MGKLEAFNKATRIARLLMNRSIPDEFSSGQERSWSYTILPPKFLPSTSKAIENVTICERIAFISASIFGMVFEINLYGNQSLLIASI